MPADESLSRREFLGRAAKAGACLAAAGAIAYATHDPAGPGPASVEPQAAALPDFSIPGQGKKMCIAHGSDRARTLQLALQALGGIETFIRKGRSRPAQGQRRLCLAAHAVGHDPSRLVAELTRLCLKPPAPRTVAVTDNPINDPASCFALTGIGQAARSAGADLILPEERFFKPMTVKGAQLIRNWPVLMVPLAGVTKLIGIAPVKDHHRSGASMVMKNWYGLLGGRRNIFHQDIQTIIAELAGMVQPTLVVLDGTSTMMTNGPTGGSLADLKETRTLIVGTDQVAVDAFGATLLGKTAADLPFIAKAEALGAGTADYRSLSPVEVSA